ncbi:MAG: ribonuclease III [Sedimentisphaerales bacterium]|nr:ribonuclease III [Sedimentisphaerales bacterium]
MTIEDTFLDTCQEAIGYRFANLYWLEQALTHASAADSRLQSNERLEFLGDAILGIVICHELFLRFSDYLEGELTKIKSMLVSRRTCSRIAEEIGLTRFLRVGKGMISQRKLPRSCAAAAVEAIIGAVYLDGGEKEARRFILRFFGPLLDEADAAQHQGNFKSMLQQYAQHALDTTPIYEILDEKGPDHSKCFEVSVVIGSRRFASGWGTSKKEAEQLAAFHALQELDVIAPDVAYPVPAVG